MNGKTKEIKLGQIIDDREIRFNSIKIRQEALRENSERFAVYHIRCGGIKDRNKLTVRLMKEAWIESIRNAPLEKDERGRLDASIYLMFENSDTLREKLESIVSSMDVIDAGRPMKESLSTVDEKVALQLLLNSLHHREGDRINNAMGRCLQVQEYKDYHDEDKKGIHKEIVCLEYLFKNDSSLTSEDDQSIYLTVKVVTLTNIRESKYMAFKNGNTVDSYPQYVTDAYGIRSYDAENDRDAERYIERVTRYHEKNTVKFFHTGSPNILEDSRSAQVNRKIEMLNRRYPELDMRFETVRTSVFEPNGNTSNNKHNQRARELVEGCDIEYVNLAGEQYDKEFRDMKSHLGLKNRSSLDSFTEERVRVAFILHHELDYYDDLRKKAESDSERDSIIDPYGTYDGADCIQHISVERIQDIYSLSPKEADMRWKTFSENNIENMAVKLENHRRRMLLSDWPFRDPDGIPLEKDLKIAMRREDSDEDNYLMISLQPNGSFEIQELDESSEDYDLLDAMMADTSNIEAGIKDSDGNINLIWSTEIITIPETRPMAD